MEDIWHFNQSAGLGAPFLTSPDKAQNVYVQYERDSIARYLNIAVNKVAGELHYWPRPSWFSETIPLSRSVPYQLQTHNVAWRKLIAFGQRATSVIQSSAPVSYLSSGYLGTVDDVASITVATTVALDEIQIFYEVSNFAGIQGFVINAADPRIQIEPITLTDNGNGTVTINAPRALFVLPGKWMFPYQSTDPNQREINTVDTSDPTGFVTAVDVYRVYNDTTNAIQVLASDGTVVQSFAGEILHPEMGIFRLGDLCAGWPATCDYPKRMNVRYYSGEALFNGAMDIEFAETLVSFANALMDERFTSFSRWTLDRWEKDQSPIVANGVNSGTMPILSQTAAKDPFGWGLKRGQTRATAMVIDRGIQQGGKITRSIRW